MTTSISASFINLDVELESGEDLAPLAQHFGRRTFVLQCGATETEPPRFRLAMEALTDGQLECDPQRCTDHFLALVESLPPVLQALWSGCGSRVFDYGFEGGRDATPFAAVIDAARVSRVAALGVDLRITVYAYREPDADTACAET